VLLSSLQGGAVTSLQIDGVLHEFSSIPGVREDVTDIVLQAAAGAEGQPGGQELDRPDAGSPLRPAATSKSQTTVRCPDVPPRPRPSHSRSSRNNQD